MKKIFVCMLFMVAMALLLTGCDLLDAQSDSDPINVSTPQPSYDSSGVDEYESDNGSADEYEYEVYAEGSATINEYTDAEPANMAGWIAIYGGRLHVVEARVIVYDFLYPHLSFARHAGENVTVVAHGERERLYELGFESDDDWHNAAPNGFVIENLELGTVSYEITDDTIFEFVDTMLRFLGEDSEGSRNYQTTVLEEFIEHRGGSESIVFIQVKDGRVISVTEEFLFAQ